MFFGSSVAVVTVELVLDSSVLLLPCVMTVELVLCSSVLLLPCGDCQTCAELLFCSSVLPMFGDC